LPNDVIIDKVNGLFCDRDVADIIDKLKFLIDNKKIHRAMKDNIRATYINRLGVEVQKARWKSLFNAVLNE
jgi:glycosyltransferase involved in cell wall biosynthesis